VKRTLENDGYAWVRVERNARSISCVGRRTAPSMSHQAHRRAREDLSRGLGDLRRNGRARHPRPGNGRSLRCVRPQGRRASGPGAWCVQQRLGQTRSRRRSPGQAAVRGAPRGEARSGQARSRRARRRRSPGRARSGRPWARRLGKPQLLRRHSAFPRRGQTRCDALPLRINNWVAPTSRCPRGSCACASSNLPCSRRAPAGSPRRRNGVPRAAQDRPESRRSVLGYLDTHGSSGWSDACGSSLEPCASTFNTSIPLPTSATWTRFSTTSCSVIPRSPCPSICGRPGEPTHRLLYQRDPSSLLFVDGRDLKIQPEVRGYVPLGDYFTVGGRAAAGMLFPFNYGDTLEPLLADPAGARTAAQVRDLQLMYFRACSRRPRIERGYPPRTISPHAVVPFLSRAPRPRASRANVRGRTATRRFARYR